MFKFRSDKAIQAAGVIAACEGKCMEYLRMLKLLYIAERETLKETGSPLIGERFVAMNKGPLHDDVYALLKDERADSHLWNEHFERDHVQLMLRRDPGVGKLSRFEVRKLQEVSTRYLDMSTWDLVKVTHEFDEWKDNYPDPTASTSKRIPAKDVLRGVGLSDAEILDIEARQREAAELEEALG